MSEKWEDVANVPIGTTVISQGLNIQTVVVGRSKDYRNGYDLDLNVPADNGARCRMTINRRIIRVHRVPLLPKP